MQVAALISYIHFRYVLYQYNQIMYNTFQLDEQPIETSSATLKHQFNERAQNKFASGTMTKNFFSSQYQEDNTDYISPATNKKSGDIVKIEQPLQKQHNLKKESRRASKLDPIKHSDKVQVYQNYTKRNNLQALQEVSLDCSTIPLKQVGQSPESQARKRRRKTKKEDKTQSKSKQFQPEQIKIPLKSTQILFQDQQQPRNLPNPPDILIPQTRIINDFNDQEDEEPVISSTQAQTTSIITGSQYFDFSNEVTLTKQLYLNVREKTTLRMEIVRDKDGFNTFWPEFHLHFAEDSHYVMSAKKTSSRPTSTFMISRSKNNFEQFGPYYMGKIKSNVLGDVLNIFGPGMNPRNAKDNNIQPRQLLATLVFITSLFQMGKPRQFRIFIKNPQVDYYKGFAQVRMYEEQIPLHTLYQFPQNKQKIRVLHNRQPVWINQIGGYMLNFKGRVERPSIKNFIIQENVNGPEVILFGKVNQNKFNFDVSSKVSTFIAFAVALSSFDSRLMCQ